MSSPFLTLCLALLGALSGSVTGIDPPYTDLGERSEVYALPALPYPYEGLEPWVDAATVRAHHQGHHDTYRRRMNDLLAQWRDQEPQNPFVTEPIVRVLQRLDLVPDLFRTKLRNNMGGFINHCLYWAVMSPNPGGAPRTPTGALLAELQAAFGSLDGFKAAFTSAALDLFGSGYVWLLRHHAEPAGQQLSIMSTTNQDSPLSPEAEPLLVIDVWEHAYYLKHQYRRAQYVADWWNVVDWSAVEHLDQFWVKLRSPPRDLHNDL